jgi:DNA-binding beta-propeller fold protein YncE
MDTLMTRTGLSRRAAGLALLGAAIAPRAVMAATAPAPNIYYLSGSKVMTAATDGTGLRTVCTGRAGGLNDGIAYDPVTKRIFWTNMGKADADDGFLQSVNLDGSDLQLVVPPGGTFTPKQMKIDVKARKLYWSDREGMKIQRCNIDGSNIETLLVTGDPVANKGDSTLWCVGIALDLDKKQIYWTQKGGEKGGPGRGSIRRMSINAPAGQTSTTRKDVEVLFDKLPEPIDLDIDPTKRQLYWTDRSDNSVSRAPMDAKGFDPAKRADRVILVHDVPAAIGVALDLKANCMAYTGLAGEVGCAGLDGKGAKMIVPRPAERGAGATGIILV